MLICHWLGDFPHRSLLDNEKSFPSSSYLWDCLGFARTKHAWSKFHHFMEMAIPSIHSSGDLSCMISPHAVITILLSTTHSSRRLDRRCLCFLHFNCSLLSGGMFSKKNRTLCHSFTGEGAKE